MSRNRSFPSAAGLTFSLTIFLLSLCLSPGVWADPMGRSDPHAVPWWDQFPGLIQTSDVTLAQHSHANAALCGAADDPTWGLFGQRQRLKGGGERTIRNLHVRSGGLGFLPTSTPMTSLRRGRVFTPATAARP